MMGWGALSRPRPIILQIKGEIMEGKRTRPLIVGAGLVIFFLVLRVVLPLLLSPTAGQTASFLTVFLAILMAFIFFGVVFTSRELSGRVSQPVYNVVEKLIIAGILLGVVGMFQPWAQVLYRIGFLLLLVSTLAFIVWSHIAPQAARYDEDTGDLVLNEPQSNS
jgi:hypothetical protein